MSLHTFISRYVWTIAVTLLFVNLSLLVNSTNATTIVRFESNLGSIDVRLYEEATPQSVANFLAYANADSWDGTVIHRSVPGFIVQGGGFSLTPDVFNSTQVTANAPVQNEPEISNLRGTLAYAKIGGDPDSATSQWFFNLNNNAANLDFQNGGFTVFGRVIGTGMTVVDNIAALDRVNAGGVFSDIPVLDLDKVLNQSNIFNEDAVVFSDVFQLNTVDGDYNFDGTVDEADLAVWENDFESTLLAEADGNGNGVVDGADLLIWQRNQGATLPLLTTESIPEPTSLALTVMSILLLLRQRR